MKVNITPKTIHAKDAVPGHLYDYRCATILCFTPCSAQVISGDKRIHFVRLNEPTTGCYHSPAPAGLILDGMETVSLLGEASISNVS